MLLPPPFLPPSGATPKCSGASSQSGGTLTTKFWRMTGDLHRQLQAAETGGSPEATKREGEAGGREGESLARGGWGCRDPAHLGGGGVGSPWEPKPPGRNISPWVICRRSGKGPHPFTSRTAIHQALSGETRGGGRRGGGTEAQSFVPRQAFPAHNQETGSPLGGGVQTTAEMGKAPLKPSSSCSRRLLPTHPSG